MIAVFLNGGEARQRLLRAPCGNGTYPMNLTFLLWLLAALLLGCEQPPDVAEIGVEPIAIEADQLGLDDLKLESDIVGHLKYRGGFRLRSPDPRFGGLSWLDISADGRSFVAFSDRGYRFHGELVCDTRGNLAGTRNTRIQTLQRIDDRLFTGEEGGKCEAAARAPGGGLVVACDRGRRLLVYPEGEGAPRSMPAPADLAGAPAGGIRAIALLPDDRLLALAAEDNGAGGLFGWIGDDDGWSRVTYTTCAQRVQDMRHKVSAAQCFPQPTGPATGDLEEFWPAGATATPGGDIVVVESGFPYVATRLRRIKVGNIKPGAVLDGEELAVLEGSLAFHNIQGISVRQTASGRVVIYLVSDDNYTGPQPTAFLMFELRRMDSYPPS
jgi:hypothetical protein